MKEGVSRAADIVSSLNEFSRQKKGEKQPCNINHIINNCVLMLKHQLTENIIVYKNYDESLPFTLGNNGQLHQVFLNILTNAIHATSSGGDINIRTQKGGNKITVEIQDTGNGISPDKLNKITEPFFTTKAPGEGTGLGLSIVYNILKEHKADLRFESEVSKGTNVIIIFESQTQ
jgi:signal transduction histidine kinase